MNTAIPFEVINSDQMIEEPTPKKKLKARKISQPTLESGDAQTATAIAVASEPIAVMETVVSTTTMEMDNDELLGEVALEGQEEIEFESSAFEELNLNPLVVAGIEAAGYNTPTPIQLETIPLVLEGKDIIGRAETGSGKTAAFACPLLSMIDLSISAPQVLVLAPTRELAIQVTASFEKYGSQLKGFRAVTIYGGQSYEPQNRALSRGVQVVVGTPGRIMDHLRQGTLKLDNLKTIVLDEGDEMLRMGFIDDVEWILEQIPDQRQTLLFSATMPAPIQNIAQKHLRKPITVSIDTETAAAESIEQKFILVQPKTKIDMLAQILESEETEGIIVFVKTRNTTVQVADQLAQRGFSAAPLNGEIPQNQRERTIEHLKSGRLDVLVATDVAARGLDVQRISHVVNFDFPHDTEVYIHRIGRTGRAGRDGNAILFVEPKEQGKLKRLQRETNQSIGQYRQKSVDEINQIRVAHFKQQITDTISGSKGMELFTKIIGQYHQETGAPMEQVAAALGLLAQGDTPLLLKEVVNARTTWKSDREKGGKRFQGEMEAYRIEVGRKHGVGPGNIVGAITNEAQLEYAAVGRIKLFEDFSVIELPANLPPAVIDQLQNVVVSGQKLQIAKDRHGLKTLERPGRSSHRGEYRSERRGDREPRREGGRDGDGKRKSFSNKWSDSTERTERRPRVHSDRFGKDRFEKDRSGKDRFESRGENRGDNRGKGRFETRGKDRFEGRGESRGKSRPAGERSVAPRGERKTERGPQKKFVKVRASK